MCVVCECVYLVYFVCVPVCLCCFTLFCIYCEQYVALILIKFWRFLVIVFYYYAVKFSDRKKISVMRVARVSIILHFFALSG